MRTRCWEDPEGCSNTVVQVRDDARPMVHVHSNIGWLPISNAPEDWDAAVAMAESLARGWGLEESSRGRALWMAGE